MSHITQAGRGVRYMLAAAAGAALMLAAAGPGQAQEEVRIAGLTWPGYGFWFIVKEKGLAPGHEISYQAIEDPFQSFSLAASGQLDIISSTIEYTPIGTAEGAPVKLVSYGNLSYGTDSIIVAPGVDSPEDLRGKSIAVLEGGLSQLFVGMWLEQHGIAIDEVKFVNLIMDHAASALIGGDVAAAEFWEPFGSQALAALPEARIVANSRDAEWTRLALIADAHFMADDFITERPEAARAMLQGLFKAISWWRQNPEEGNRIIAEGMRLPVSDVELVLGKDGTGKDGGLYPYDFMEAARFCGVAPGDPPFEQSNGQIVDHFKMTNEWWVKFGLMDRTVDPQDGIDCTLLGDLHEAGFRGE